MRSAISLLRRVCHSGYSSLWKAEGVWGRVVLLLTMLTSARGLCARQIARFGHNAAIRDQKSLQMQPCRGVDTIYALSSGQGKAGVSVIRISGPISAVCLRTLLHNPQVGIMTDMTPAQSFPRPRRAVVRKLFSPVDQTLLDMALVLWFPGPQSFTGEDVVELHVHGSRAVINGVFEALENIRAQAPDDEVLYLRPAERGEFTQRAYENGKMDLTEVEGLADLIAADTTEQRKLALQQMQGSLRAVYQKWVEELKRCLAHTEAVIDFGEDEHDVGEDAFPALTPRVRALRDDMMAHLSDNRRGEIIRSGVRIAIVGPPNAGKSSLLNALAKRDAAIVSPIAGTTRDVIDVQLDLDGFNVIVSDTAGIRTDAENLVELEGIRRAKRALDDAHILVFISDVTDPSSVAEMSAMLSSWTQTTSQRAIVAVNKVDLLGKYINTSDEKQLLETIGDVLCLGKPFNAANIQAVCGVSCKAGTGVDGFANALNMVVRQQLEATGTESALITRERHRNHVNNALECLESFLENSLPMDLAAEELRLAVRHIGRITGTVDVEDLLDIIFKDFCIGK